MATIFKIKNSVTTTAAPTTLVQGEAAVNITDKKLWVGNAASSPIQLLGAGATISGTDVNYTGTLAGGTGVVNLGSGQFYKDASGNVGIGTSSPVNKLDVQSAVSATPVTNGVARIVTTGTNPATGYGGGLLFAQQNSAGTYANYASITGSRVNSAANDKVDLVFSTGSPTDSIPVAERMRIDSSGNVGIGTSSPASKLSVTSGTSGGSIDINYTGAISTGSEYTSLRFTSSPYGFVGSEIRGVNTNGGTNLGVMQLFTSGTERMRIDSSGNLLVGTTTNVYSNSDSFILDKTSGYQVFNHLNTRTSGAGYILFGYNGGQIGSITQNGTTAVAYNTSSDYRLKENIAPMTGALDVVSKLKPVTYNWKSDGSDGQGFIAHELQAVIPDCVTGEKDATRIEQYEITPAIPATLDEDGKVIKEAVEAVMGERVVPVYQGIDTSFLVATLTAAIQEQQAMINELKAKVAALEAA